MIALHTGGVARFQTRLGDRWTEPCLPEQVFWIPADFLTTWQVNGRLEFIGVHLGASALERIAREAGIPSGDLARLPFRPGFHDAFASSACTTLAKEAAHGGGRARFAELLAETLGVYLAQNAGQPRDVSALTQVFAGDVFERTLDRIEASIDSGISIAEIALETGFSNQAHFTNRFREHVELTPRQYRRGVGRAS